MVTTDATQALVEVYCRELKLAGLRQIYQAVARDAANNGQSYLTFLVGCLAQEIESRKRNRLADHLREARLPVVKTLESFDFLALPHLPKMKVISLADGAFIRAHENVICLGSPGTGNPQPAQYPYRSEVLSRPDRHGRRSAPSALWANSSPRRHHEREQALPRALLRGLGSSRR